MIQIFIGFPHKVGDIYAEIILQPLLTSKQAQSNFQQFVITNQSNTDDLSPFLSFDDPLNLFIALKQSPDSSFHLCYNELLRQTQRGSGSWEK